MPNAIIHFAIAKVYTEKHKVKDFKSFMQGSISPDLIRAEGIEHPYKRQRQLDPKNIKESTTDRLDFEKYLKENETKTDFQKGAFLHLLIDNYCFPQIFDFEKFQKALDDGANLKASIHYNLTKVSGYIAEKYKVDIMSIGLEEILNKNEEAWAKDMENLNYADNILDVNKLDEFIDKITEEELETTIKRIKRGGKV